MMIDADCSLNVRITGKVFVIGFIGNY